MPKKLPEHLNAKIEAEVARHRGGIGVDELHGVLADLVSRRTLQRRLAELVDQQHLSAVGEGKARVYLLPADIEIDTGTEAREPGEETGIAVEVYVPISPDSRDILSYIRRPVQRRKPVGYDRVFLEAYRPNESHYLSQAVRDHLYRIGRSPDGERPAGTYARDMLGRLLIDLSWASSRLEGNTYTRLDTQNLIELGQVAKGKDRREAQMILNHKAAIELMVEQAAEVGFNRYAILNLHALLSDNLLADPQACGRLRTIPAIGNAAADR